MKFHLCSIALFLTFGAILSVPQSASAQSQAEMNQAAAEDFAKADKALNATYKKLVALIDEESAEKLKVAQRAWIVFRDAEAELAADMGARGGSMAPLIYNGRRADLTRERTKQLQVIIKENSEQ